MDDGVDKWQARERKIGEWRAARIERFTNRQKAKGSARAWVRLSDLAERYARERDRDEGYRKLQNAILSGEFERGGRSRLLYLHPSSTKARMTRQWLCDRMALGFTSSDIFEAYVAPCWVPREMAVAWCAKNQLSVAGWLTVETRQSPRQIGRPKGSTSYDDQRYLDRTSELVASGFNETDAISVAIKELGMPAGSKAAGRKRIKRKFANQGCARKSGGAS